jgi:hypothetical protein
LIWISTFVVCCGKFEFGDGVVVFENDSIIGACYFFAGVKGAKILIFTVKVEVVLGISFRSLFSCTPLNPVDGRTFSFFL